MCQDGSDHGLFKQQGSCTREQGAVTPPTCLQRGLKAPQDGPRGARQRFQEVHLQQRCATLGRHAGGSRAHSGVGGGGKQDQVTGAQLQRVRGEVMSKNRSGGCS